MVGRLWGEEDKRKKDERPRKGQDARPRSNMLSSVSGYTILKTNTQNPHHSFLIRLHMYHWWLRGQSVCLQCGRPGFDPWVGKIPWRRKWQPAPVFLPGRPHGQRSLVGHSPWGSQRVRHDWVTLLALLINISINKMVCTHLCFIFLTPSPTIRCFSLLRS